MSHRLEYRLVGWILLRFNWNKYMKSWSTPTGKRTSRSKPHLTFSSQVAYCLLYFRRNLIEVRIFDSFVHSSHCRILVRADVETILRLLSSYMHCNKFGLLRMEFAMNTTVCNKNRLQSLNEHSFELPHNHRKHCKWQAERFLTLSPFFTLITAGKSINFLAVERIA